MFSQNEKYGQALHLQYGFNTPAQMPVRAPKKNVLDMFKSAFLSKNSAEQTSFTNTTTEISLDKQTIEQAVIMELRNTDAAANENRLEIINDKIA